MDNVLPPPRPAEHVFSQSSNSIASASLRSVTNTHCHSSMAVANNNNGNHGGSNNNNNASSKMMPRLEVEEQRPPLQLHHQNNDSNNNNDDNEDEDEANTQETFTQHEMTQGNELTQLGMDDDDDDDDDENAALSQSQDCNSPAPIDPLTVPWGRLMPVGPNNNNNDGGGAHFGEGAPPSAGTAAVGTSSNHSTTTRPNYSSREALEMLPRMPARAASIGTRSRSPSLGGGGGGEGNNNNSQHSQHSSGPMSSPPCIHFLGLRNLLPSDRFNEYVLGRSVKADATAQKMEVSANIPTETNPETQQRNESKRKRNDYVHAMISNRHCRIFCLLSNCGNGSNAGGSNNGPPEMEVFVEDTSGNGTLINGTTLLRRNERRKLHTGDVICLLNPKLLSKKLRSVAERKMYMSQYSYVFVNLYEQEARHGWGVMSGGGGGKATTRGGGDLASPISSSKKRGAVNPRATKCHSRDNAKGRRSLFSNAGNGARQYPQQQLSKNNNKQSLGSFLNKPHNQSTNASSDAQNRRRIEEEYDLRDLLGTGTCGEVRRAIHRRTGEERAVKIISIGGRGGAGPGMSSEKLTAIQAEAEILRSLDHPYVVKLFDMFIAPGKAIYLVMELIRGGDLFDRIVERERYTETQARQLFRRILTAVHYLHEDRGIVHRDLKPENILVVDRRSDVNVKLTDFGLAKNMTAEGLKTFCGTPQYFAPEVLRRRHTVRGAGRYGKEIDCWSIGVILFILLSGSPPFDVSAGFDAVANAEVIFYEDQWRRVSREAQDLVRRLLEKDPRRRMSVKDACEHEWVLKEDGDTHCHPLHDPVVLKTMKKDGAPVALSKSDCKEGRQDDVSKADRSVKAGPVSGAPLKPVHAASAAQNCKPNRVSEVPSKPHSFLNAARSTQNGKASRVSDIPSKPLTSSSHAAKYRSINEAKKSGNAPSKPPFSPSRQICGPVDGNALSPTSAHNKRNKKQQKEFLSKSAPQLAKDGRHPSVWPANGNDKTVTKAIQQGCHTSQPSPNGSPIKKRQLFNRSHPSSKDESVRKKIITKQGVESIRAAGNTLPTPVIDKESHLIKKVAAPKKKVQSTLFSVDSFKKEDRNSKPAAPLPEKKESGNSSIKRKSSSTVTPPGQETNNGLPTFRLNKKHKVGGKTISPENRIATATATAAAVAAPAKKKKAELSEDELQDFSDDDEAGDPFASLAANCGNSPQKYEKKPLEKYLRKRKMESIESSASFDFGSKAQSAIRGHSNMKDEQSREEEAPRPVSKSSVDGNAETGHPQSVDDGQSSSVSSSTTKDRRMVQTFLFGRPPPTPSTNDGANSLSNIENGPGRDGDSSISAGMQVGEGTALCRRSTGDSLVSGLGDGVAVTTATVPKGKQKSIKSWFRPKK